MLIIESFFWRVGKIAKSDYYLRHVCLSVCPFILMSDRTEQLGSQYTDFDEI